MNITVIYPNKRKKLSVTYGTAHLVIDRLLRGGELYTNICGRAILTEEEAFRIIYPLTDCLCYLHRMGIIHRDIKVGLLRGIHA